MIVVINKHYMNARYYAFALSGRALTRLCQLPRVALRSALGYGLLPFQGVYVETMRSLWETSMLPVVAQHQIIYSSFRSTFETQSLRD